MTAQTVSSAVATRETGIVNVMWDRKAHFAAVLPDHIDVKSFLGTAAAALYASTGRGSLTEAAEHSPDSLITALMRCAALGHQPGTEEFYLTPRPSKNGPVVLGIEGYRGIVERMYRSGAVQTVIVREVCQLDGFDYVEGRDDKPRHDFGGSSHAGISKTGADFFGTHGSRDRGEMVGVYAYAILTTGAVSRVAILNRDDVLAARDAGGYKADDKYSPWNRLDAGHGRPEFTGRSMWWKTAARRLEPWVPTSAEYRREQLRAAAAASQAVPPPAPNGTVKHPGPAVPDETPVSGPAAGPGTTRPSKAAGDRLEKLLARLPLGDEHDTAVMLAWLAGKPVDVEYTAADVRTVTSVLEDELSQAGGDTEETVSRLWGKYRAANPQAGDEGA